MKAQEVYCLRDTDIYHGLCPRKALQTNKNIVETSFRQGHMFYTDSQRVTDIYIIKSGEVELYKLQNGKKIVLETLFPGDIFGNFSGNLAGSHYARASRKTQVCKTPTKEFLKLVQRFPEITLNLLTELAKKTQYYEEKIAALSSSAKDQLWHELKNLSQKNKQSVLGKIFDIPLRISHQKLAEKTGLNRVTVTKLMKELKDEQKISVDEKTKIIKLR
ncbi:hypothetical protein CSB37_01825 [bacterium DOLZORAL124_38_8]|nr:MAG: hypothetical protein CSB37_01825 [bacterium DOLZORAL124_38_8]